MREDGGESYPHHNQKAGEEAAEVQDAIAGALDEVVRVGAARSNPVGYGSQHVGGNDQQRIVDLV